MSTLLWSYICKSKLQFSFSYKSTHFDVYQSLEEFDQILDFDSQENECGFIGFHLTYREVGF